MVFPDVWHVPIVFLCFLQSVVNIEDGKMVHVQKWGDKETTLVREVTGKNLTLVSVLTWRFSICRHVPGCIVSHSNSLCRLSLLEKSFARVIMRRQSKNPNTRISGQHPPESADGPEATKTSRQDKLSIDCCSFVQDCHDLLTSLLTVNPPRALMFVPEEIHFFFFSVLVFLFKDYVVQGASKLEK